jgi:hypothetical protein
MLRHLRHQVRSGQRHLIGMPRRRRDVEVRSWPPVSSYRRCSLSSNIRAAEPSVRYTCWQLEAMSTGCKAAYRVSVRDAALCVAHPVDTAELT